MNNKRYIYCIRFWTLLLLISVLRAQDIPHNISLQPKIHDDCSDAPSEVIRLTCLKLRQIDRKVRAAQPTRRAVRPPGTSAPVLRPIPVAPDSRGQVAWNPYDCMTLQCLCPFMKGRMGKDGTCILPSGKPLTMAYRKEYRQLSDAQRRRFHRAFNQLKRNGVYDQFAEQHREVATGGAHSGPGFLPWHREFIKRMEIALRLIDPEVALPYWDSVMDNYLPNPRDSVFFSPEFVGETDANGFVVNGPFAFWPTLEGRNTIWRSLSGEGGLFTEGQLISVANERNIRNVLAYTAPLPDCPIPPNYNALEYTHSNVHFWVGGDLRTPEFSANDPIFYLHHSFVDLIFEIWRQRQQPRNAREWEYTPDLWSCANDQHFSWAWMRPFDSLTNRDGLANAYTDQLYRYALRPTCTQRTPNACGSKYLFCDLNHGLPHCVPKVKMGGNCAGFEGMDACHEGQCWLGQCVPGNPPTTTSATQKQSKSRGPSSVAAGNRQRLRQNGRRQLAAPTFSVTIEPFLPSPGSSPVFPLVPCFNRHPCCEHWAAQGECGRNGDYMGEFCRAACAFCVPTAAHNNASATCRDLHLSCAQWSEQGECGRNTAAADATSLFLAENCRQSCGLCDQDKVEANSCASSP